MDVEKIEIQYKRADYKDFTGDEKSLVESAKNQTLSAYAPYSKFNVGAAVLLDNGQVIGGNNQENIAYPSGLCAERTAMFYANAKYPNAKPLAIAIAAKNEKGYLPSPICPCGSCRQVLLESEMRFGSPIKVILYGTRHSYIIDSIADMMPFAFVSLE